MECKICNHKSQLLFKAIVLQKYDVSYFKCEHCGFVQTEQPYWLNEAYNNAITDFDIGYVTRNLVYRNIVSSVIRKIFDKRGVFLDYGGGYGLFVRLMRDMGFKYFRQDNYCDNIFANHFDVKDINRNSFDLLTSFEVFEHLEDPLKEIEKMLSYSDSILFSTTLLPVYTIDSSTGWDYFAPEMGQHISFYTSEALSIIAEKYNLNIYTNNKDLHLLTSKKIKFNWLKYIYIKQQIIDKILKRNFCNKKSLISEDVNLIKKKLCVFEHNLYL